MKEKVHEHSGSRSQGASTLEEMAPEEGGRPASGGQAGGGSAWGGAAGAGSDRAPDDVSTLPGMGSGGGGAQTVHPAAAGGRRAGGLGARGISRVRTRVSKEPAHRILNVAGKFGTSGATAVSAQGRRGSRLFPALSIWWKQGGRPRSWGE